MQQSETALQVVTLAAQMILASQGEIYRAEDTAIRLLHSFGFTEAQILCFPTGFSLSATSPEGKHVGRTARIADRSIDMTMLDGVNSISRRVSAGELDAEKALFALQELARQPKLSNTLLSLAFAMSAGFFCVMFGGGIKEFVMAVLAGGGVHSLLPLLRRWHAPPLLTSLAGGVLAAGLSLLMLKMVGGSQEAVISGTIMPLLPGLTMTNAVRDTMRGDLVAGVARGTEALLSAIMLAAGVAVVLML